jgi:hypothetical protein
MKKNQQKQMKQRKNKNRGRSNKTISPKNVVYKTLSGYNDGYGATTPVGYAIQAGSPYFDYQLTGLSVTNSPGYGSMLTPLLGSTGLLASYPQITVPVITGTVAQFYQEIRITSILLEVTAIGSQSATIVAADLFNQLRVLMFWSGETYQSSLINPVLSPNQWPNMQDVEEVLYDAKYDLPSVSFDTTNTTNTPMIRSWRGLVPVNRTLECFASAPGTVWETKSGDLALAYGSDSAITPNPTLTVCARVFYDIVRRVR